MSIMAYSKRYPNIYFLFVNLFSKALINFELNFKGTIIWISTLDNFLLFHIQFEKSNSIEQILINEKILFSLRLKFLYFSMNILLFRIYLE